MTYHVKFTDEEIKQLAKDIGDHLNIWMIHQAYNQPPAPGWTHEPRSGGGVFKRESVQEPSPLHSPFPPPKSEPLTPPRGTVQNEAMLDKVVVRLAPLLAPRFGVDARQIARNWIIGTIKEGMIDLKAPPQPSEPPRIPIGWKCRSCGYGRDFSDTNLNESARRNLEMGTCPSCERSRQLSISFTGEGEDKI